MGKGDGKRRRNNIYGKRRRRYGKVKGVIEKLEGEMQKGDRVRG